jgi:hypothetical protein
MDHFAEDAMRVALIGIGATAILDAWLFALNRVGVRTLDMALIGRWAGHLARGRFRHDGIVKAAPVKGERALGWLVHYAVGVVFAGVLVVTQGVDWARQPSLLPALYVGMASVAAPLFVMQPSMGAGIASSRTPSPVANSLRSFVNHTIFGAGLYLAALCIQ